MTNSELLLERINSFYIKRNPQEKTTRDATSYKKLCDNHLNIINSLDTFWNDVNTYQPKDNEKVFCIMDLTPIGKGKFIDMLFYENNNFVASLGDDDPYGYITHWIGVDKIDTRLNFSYYLK